MADREAETKNALLTYFWVYSVQPDQLEVDLNVVMTILELGVPIDAKDVMGQTVLFVMVRTLGYFGGVKAMRPVKCTRILEKF